MIRNSSKMPTRYNWHTQKILQSQTNNKSQTNKELKDHRLKDLLNGEEQTNWRPNILKNQGSQVNKTKSRT